VKVTRYVSEVCYELNVVGLNLTVRKPAFGPALVQLEMPGPHQTLNEHAFAAWMEAFREAERILQSETCSH
jgi:hypothetical protein